MKPTKTYSVTVKLSQYGTKTKECFNTSTYTISYKPKKEKGYVRIIVPLSDNLWKTDAAVDCNYECDFTFLEELKES